MVIDGVTTFPVSVDTFGVATAPSNINLVVPQQTIVSATHINDLRKAVAAVETEILNPTTNIFQTVSIPDGTGLGFTFASTETWTEINKGSSPFSVSVTNASVGNYLISFRGIIKYSVPIDAVASFKLSIKLTNDIGTPIDLTAGPTNKLNLTGTSHIINEIVFGSTPIELLGLYADATTGTSVALPKEQNKKSADFSVIVPVVATGNFTAQLVGAAAMNEKIDFDTNLYSLSARRI